MQLDVFALEKEAQLGDWTRSEIDKIRKWRDSIFYQTREESEIKKDRCEICYSKEDLERLQLHHPAGIKHDYRTTTACIECHTWLSNRQKIWDRRWLEENQPENIRLAFFLLGMKDIFELKSIKTGNSLYLRLGESYTEKISALFGRL